MASYPVLSFWSPPNLHVRDHHDGWKKRHKPCLAPTVECPSDWPWLAWQPSHAKIILRVYVWSNHLSERVLYNIQCRKLSSTQFTWTERTTIIRSKSGCVSWFSWVIYHSLFVSAHLVTARLNHNGDKFLCYIRTCCIILPCLRCDTIIPLRYNMFYCCFCLIYLQFPI